MDRLQYMNGQVAGLFMYGWMNGWTDGMMDGVMDGFVGVCIYTMQVVKLFIGRWQISDFLQILSYLYIDELSDTLTIRHFEHHIKCMKKESYGLLL